MSSFALLIALSLCQVAWIVLGVLWVARRHDEIPLLIGAVLFYVFTFRLWALVMGWASPTDLTNFGFNPLDPGSALEVE
jgi:Mg/Co/Ni transporter MgtE